MDPDEGVRAGNDLMLNTFADGSLSDTSSATGVAVIMVAGAALLLRKKKTAKA